MMQVHFCYKVHYQHPSNVTIIKFSWSASGSNHSLKNGDLPTLELSVYMAHVYLTLNQGGPYQLQVTIQMSAGKHGNQVPMEYLTCMTEDSGW